MTRPDRASTLRRLRGLAFGAMLATAATMVAAPVASAADSTAPDVNGTLWLVPGEGNLSGIVEFVYVASEPAPGATQVPAAYSHVMQFFTASGLPGYVGLSSDGAGSGTAFLNLAGPVSIPFAWSPGRIYGLVAYATGPDTFAGAVYDYSAATWTAIGQKTAPGVGNSLLPFGRSHVFWQGVAANSCSAYPLDDTYVTPIIGVRNGTSTVGMELGPYVQAGGCPGQITDESGWVHYQIGAAA